jgi:hypothetical protein
MGEPMTNVELFEYSGKHPVPLIDPYYNKDKIIIPPTKELTNELIEANSKLIELITVFKYLNEEGRDFEDVEIKRILEKVQYILDNVIGINFSAFSQFFMVYNSAYNSYEAYSEMKKKRFIYEMLQKYCKERHSMYSSHGYSNSMLQVVCDNYSHKRNSKSTIDKIIDTIEPMGFSRLFGMKSFIEEQNFYILPDKGDVDVYQQIVRELSLETRALSQEQDKLPDFVLKYKDEYYIGEAKMMKGSGGGQDKQLVEIINFIRYQEQNDKVHYIVYFDGEYANMLWNSGRRSPKIDRQYQAIVECLMSNPGNFFVNPDGFVAMLNELYTRE